MRTPQLVSIELTQRCSKGCHFCYNGSGPDRSLAWRADDAIALLRDVARHGTEAISIGGGEPLQYEALDEVFAALKGRVYLTMTTNGLLLDEQLDRVSRLSPDKMHISVHFPHNSKEVDRVIRQVTTLRRMGLRAGVNLLVRDDNVDAARDAARRLNAAGIGNALIVYLPMRGAHTPSPAQLADVAGAPQFQSMSCLAACGRSPRFCSIDARGYAAHCSFTTERRKLQDFTAAALHDALRDLGIRYCGEAMNTTQSP